MIIAVLLFGLCTGLGIGWVLGIAYGVKREQDYQLAQARRRLTSKGRWPDPSDWGF